MVRQNSRDTEDNRLKLVSDPLKSHEMFEILKDNVQRLTRRRVGYGWSQRPLDMKNRKLFSVRKDAQCFTISVLLITGS